MKWTQYTGQPLKPGMPVRWFASDVHIVQFVDAGGITVKAKGKSSIVISIQSNIEIGVDKGAPVVVSSDSPNNRKGGSMGVSKVPIADNSKNTGGPCLCGCGELVPSYFKRGHVSSWNGKLRKIASGADTPYRVLGRSIAARLGPWKNKGLGQVPSKTYKDLR